MTDELVETVEQKLARYETVIGLQMEEIDRLRNVVAKLTGTDDAHSTLRRLYLDESQSSTARIKAAAAALNFEKGRVESVPPAIDSTCEEIEPEPLAQLVERQRRRADAMLREPRDIEVSPTGIVRVLPKPGSNGSDGQD